jgi:endonuclease/exonuclease/phosphatase family metal-dependent hydrolase
VRIGAVRVATFNILHGARPGGEPDLPALTRSCAALDADVLALQEVDVRTRRNHYRDLVDVVVAATGMQAMFGPAVRIGWRGRYGNTLLVRGRMSHAEVLPLPRPRQAEPRSCIVARADLDNGVGVSVAATHLSVDGAESPEQLDVLLAALAARPKPRLVLGDFNLRPEVVVPALEAAGYVVADPGLLTFPADDPAIRIDYIAADGLDVAAVTAQRLDVSDHLALVCELTAVDEVGSG